MVDTKKFEQYVSRRTELYAEMDVCKKLNEFMFENTIKCRNELDVYKLQAWIDVSKEVHELIEKRLDNINVEIQELKKQLDKEGA